MMGGELENAAPSIKTVAAEREVGHRTAWQCCGRCSGVPLLPTRARVLPPQPRHTRNQPLCRV